MKGPFKKQIFDIYSDPHREETQNLNFDFSYMLGTFGCQSLLQFSLLTDISKVKETFSSLDSRSMEDCTGHINDASDAIMTPDAKFQRIETEESIFTRAKVFK